METLIQDLRVSFRMLRKSPAFTVIAVITLALGIGANTAIFSIVNGVLLRPLALPQADRLLYLTDMSQSANGTMTEGTTSYPDFFDWRERARSFQGMASYHGDVTTLTGVSEPLHLSSSVVSGDFFSVVGVKPLLGRTFVRDDEKPGARVTVLSHQLWQSSFGADPAIVGRVITLDNQRFTVIGVMPAGFVFPLEDAPPKLWRPLSMEAETSPSSPKPVTQARGAHFISVVARLKDGVPIERAGEEMNVIASGLAVQYPDTNKRHSAVKTVTQLEHLVGDVRPSLIVLLASVGCVLLIACVNVANLLLVRASRRAREIAVRAALGAKKGRIIRQMLSESLVLSLAGAILGVPLAMWLMKLFIRLNAQSLPRVQSIGLDGEVLLFTAFVALLTSVLFGLAPALKASKPNLTEFMKEGRSSTAAKPHQRLRSTLVVAETALGLVLLVVAGLLLRSFNRLSHVDPGFDTKNLLTFTFDLPESKYNAERQVIFYRELLSKLNALPGVTSVAGMTPLPLSGAVYVISFQIPGRPVPTADEPSAGIRFNTPGYFKTLGIPFLQGRDFDERDQANSPSVTIINDVFARQYFPNEDPIGKYIEPGVGGGKKRPRQIIGVVGSVKHMSLSGNPTAEYYLPNTQEGAFGPLTICMKTATDPYSVLPAAKSVVTSLDPDLPVYDAYTMQRYVADVLSTPRSHALLLEAFAGLALLLTALGLYGVVAYTVSQRTHEIGVRMTLGATRSNVTQMVLGSGFRLTALGIAIGLAGAVVAARSLTAFTKLLYGVGPTDVLTFAAVVSVLTVVSLIASYVPAYRASKVDPMIALRYE